MAQLSGYCMKTKKHEPFEGKPEIFKNPNGSYMAKGKTKGGNNMCSIMGEEKALGAIKSGDAVKKF